ncbi:DMT family transporter [Pseudoroseomonas wenyumeiae]|uniref:DMT family transporter n=2 Tax=Teichococcus wenyumeiae TaxID=2478470 RepID=A0A3A9JD89_9PROT|nr:DMT family transporter [Pseudoroseomonas wenyumeiae]RMI25785.1 DMT family transporter [Pseudoroseomonas wenyumeiae]
MGIMSIATLCGAGVNTCYRLAIQDGMPVSMVTCARGLMTLGFLMPWFLRARPSALATRRPWLHLGRCAAGTVTFLLQLLAIAWLPLADAVALISARPLWVLPLAALLLHEKVRRSRVLVTLVGFLGVLLIARPEGELSLGTPAALAAGLGAGLVLITFRALAATEPAPRVIAWYAIASVLFWGPVTLWSWQAPSLFAVAMVVMGTAFAMVIDLCASAAARRAEVGLLAPIEYLQIPASAVIGWLLFAEQPGWALLAGGLIMMGATLYLVRRGG